jgi:hypothetical protein
MIPIGSLQQTAEELMAKTASEISEDYLAGPRLCADTEKGDLSAFVIQAMLEDLRRQDGISSEWVGRPYAPCAFTQQGVDSTFTVARQQGGRLAIADEPVQFTIVRPGESLLKEAAE